jgi:exopolysaccharide biosynthesis protein
MGDTINVLLDDLLALLTRIFLFPIAFQVLLYLLLLFSFWLFVFKVLGFLKKPISPENKRALIISSTIICINVSALVVMDYRNHLRDLEVLNSSYQSNENLNVADIASGDSLSSNDLKGFADSLSLNPANPTSKAEVILQDNGLEVFRVRQNNPNAVYYVATIDLHRYQVVLDSVVDQKELTSSFAKRFNVDIAVNGEAGTTPGFTAPLGQWNGVYMVNGKLIYNTDNARRPFIYFNDENQIFYSKEQDVVKTFSSDIKNIIWGRFDLLLNGQLSISKSDVTQSNPYPRTIVGMNQQGDKAYLMVVDGRNPNHSQGLTMEECGKVLLQAGCYHAMACDQGGSSAMYHKKLGIFTRPADGGERVVYTHLGFRKI